MDVSSGSQLFVIMIVLAMLAMAVMAYRGDANAVAYIVAISNPSGAVDLIWERPPILRTGFRIWAA